MPPSLSLGEHAGSPLQPRHDVGFGRGRPPRKPLTKVALRLHLGLFTFSERSIASLYTAMKTPTVP